MQGGLANKMFQFALYKSLASKGIETYMDNFSFRPSWDFEDVKLEQIFPKIKIRYATLKDIRRLGGGADFISRLRRKTPIFRFKTVINEITDKVSPAITENLEGDYYLLGTWSTENYFKNIETVIKQEFTFQKLANSKNQEILNHLLLEESVAIHIRKGEDYNNPRMRGTCGTDYYRRAIDYMKEHLTNPKFYLFTDNKKWVEDNIQDIDYLLLDWNPTSGLECYLDMQLMSFAKHNIIANSTYSWWSAWLNANPDKIIIGPNQWFNPQNIDFSEKGRNILPPYWLAL